MKVLRLTAIAVVLVLAAGLIAANAQQAASDGGMLPDLATMARERGGPWTQPLTPLFEKAAKKHDVPLPLLLTLAYFGSAFENRGDAPTIEGGYGVMALRENALGGTSLAEAQGLTKVPKGQIKSDGPSNIDASAAVLAAYAKQMDIDRSMGLEAWLGPVIKFAGLDEENSRYFAMEVFEKLLTGLDCTNSSGERFQFGPQEIGAIDLSDLLPKDMRNTKLDPKTCSVATAGISINFGASPASSDYGPAIWDPAASCNYTAVWENKDTVIIHTIEGTAAGARSWFKNCNSQVSAHYVTSEAGGVWQCVSEGYRAWHVGCINSRSIGIENEGYASSSSHPHSLYDACGLLVRDICNSWGIAKAHHTCPPGILGHVDANNCVCGGSHWDPGGGWDWNYFIGVVQGAPPPPSYDATYHTASYPTTMVAGSTATAWAEFTNQGTAAWGHAGTRLGTSSPQDRSSPFFNSGNWIGANRPTEVDQSSVTQGQVGRFTFILKAPTTPGTYTEHYRLLEEGVTWFGPEITWTITVTAATGGISGNVKNSVGVNLSGATVTITGGGSTTTDASGNYSFTGLNAGSYTLTASKSGYNNSSSPVTVTTGNTTTQNFTLTPTDTQAPSVPTNLAATPVLPTQINLTWTASTDNVGVTGYKIFRDSVQVGTTAGTSYSDAGLTANTSYSYQVSAYDAVGNESAKCTSVNRSTPPSEYIIDNGACTFTGAWSTASASTDKYGADYAFASTAASETKTASWTPNLTAGGTFDVYCWYPIGSNRATNSPYTVYWSGGSQTVNVNQTATGGQWVLLVSDKTFSSGTAGYVKLSNNTGSTGKIVVADAVRFVMKTVDAVAPSVPIGFAATPVSMTQVNLAWNASTDNIAVGGYKIYRDGVLINTTANTNYSDTTCATNTTYSYQVSAYDTSGNESAKCTAVNATTFADTVAPSIPTNLAGTAISQTEIDLTWTASTDNVGVTGYRIYRDGIQIGASATASYSDTTCTIGTRYVYEVCAYDAAGNLSANSTGIELTTLGNDTEAPTVPANLSANGASGTEIDLAWEPSTDNVEVAGYKIYRDDVQIGTSTITSYADTTCSELASYTYKVSAYDAAGNESGRSNPATAATLDVTASTVPANLAAVAVSGTQVNLSWSASTDNVGVTEYRIYRGGAFIGLATTTSYSDTTCTQATSYSYQVSAADAVGNESAKSTAANVTTPDTIAPSTPTNLGTTVISQTQINLAWNASTDNVGVTGYKVFRDGVQIGASATAGYSDTTCQSYTTYAYTVSAYDAAGNNSGLSNSSQATTQPYTDIVVDNPAATYVGSWFTGTSAPDKYGADYNYCTSAATETKTATWTPKIDVAGYYTVYCWYPQGSNRSTMAPFAVNWDGGQQTVNVNQTSGGGQWITLVTNKKFAAGTAGYIKVGNGTGETSLNIMADAVRVVLVSSDLTAPSVPTNLAATPVSGSQVNLTWTASTDNVGVTGYRIFRNGVAVGTSTGASYSDTGLTQLTAYTYTVAAYDAMGNESAQCGSANATTWDGQAPTVPAGLSASAISPSRISLSWTASTDNIGVTGYKVYRGGAYVATSATTSYTDTGRSPSTNYSYTVTAIDARSNESAQSSAANATTPAFAEIIIDNGATTLTGVWTTASASTDKYGADYLYASTAVTEGKTATWRPTIQYAGNYNVYVWYTVGSNRATNAPYITYWDGGNATVNVNQTVTGGQWVLLQSSRHFLAGTAGYVKLGNGTGATGKIVVADAVRFVQTSGD